MCEYIVDLIIGLISGLLSGFIVSLSLKKYWDKQNHIKEFEMDRQKFCRYLQLIRDEFYVAYKNNNYDSLLLALNEEPVRETFINLSKSSEEEVKKIEAFLFELKNILHDSNCKIEKSKYNRINSELFKYCIRVLNLKEA